MFNQIMITLFLFQAIGSGAQATLCKDKSDRFVQMLLTLFWCINFVAWLLAEVKP